MAHDTYQGERPPGPDGMKGAPVQHDGREQLAARLQEVTRINLRPISSPMPAGFVGLAAATLLVAALNLGWMPATEGKNVAFALLAFVFTLQLAASIFGVLARDGVAGTGMGILAGMWGTTGLVLLFSPPGSTSKALGLLFIVAGVAMMWPAIGASMGKIAAAVVLWGTVLRFLTSGVYQWTASHTWQVITGWIGVVLCVVALYAALAMLLEGVAKRQVLPFGRRGRGREAAEGGLTDQIVTLVHEPGVREQL
jgi:succinate-acetate transporter protein